MNGASKPPKRDIMLELPTARWRTGVGNSSAVYTYITLNVNFVQPLPMVENVVTKYDRSETHIERLCVCCENSVPVIEDSW